MVIKVVRVKYNGQDVGAVSFNTETSVGAFEFESIFIESGIELSPIKMPLSKRIYSFPENNNETFKGLPCLIADSLPDDFGNAVMNAWIAAQGKSTTDITPLQRLQYTGKRKIDHIIDETTEHISAWDELAIEHGVPKSLVEMINNNLRLKIK
jgi:serine/threonine-protein kinase HipA